MKFQWLEKLFRGSRSAKERQAKLRRKAFRLRMESLEPRRVFAFLAPVNSPTGLGTNNGSAVGDFNFDGFQDVVTVGNISGRGIVSVNLGNGDGSFGAPIQTNSGNSNPLQVEVADFDGDGKEDVVTLGSYYVDSLTILKGNGDGTFGAPTPYTYSIPPTEIQVADMNGDGHPDLIEGNHFFNTTSIQLNSGTGSFGAKVDSPGVIGPTTVASADFNNDGKADLVSTSLSYFVTGGVNVQLGNGNGTVQAPRTYASGGTAIDETTGDFNLDLRPDIAFANSSGGVTILLGNGDGTFAPSVTYPVGTAVLSIRQGDFNGDHIPDLVERTGTGFAIELGVGDGTFSAPGIIAATVSNTMLAADFNADGVTDIVETNSGTLAASMNDSTPLGGSTTVSGVNFHLSVPATAVAGVPVPVTITVTDADGNVIPDFVGTVRVFSNDPRSSGATLYTFTTADAGVHTISNATTLTTAGTESILANAPFVPTTSQSIRVTPANATHLAVTAPSSTEAGTSTVFTVMALDAYNNMGAPYSGTVHLTSSDSQATLPTDYAFTDADAGIHAFTGSLGTVSSAGQRISATDAAIAAITGVSPVISVRPTDASSLSLVGGGGHIGSPHNVSVVARDRFGNIATGYSGVIHLAASDAAMVLPVNTSMVSGVAVMPVTPMTLGTQTLTANAVNDLNVSSGTETILGTAGDAARYVVTVMPSTVAGVAKSVTITVYDAFGNVAVDYAGTPLFTSSDAAMTVPYYSFTAADAGTHTFNVTMRTAGTQTLTVQDWFNAAISSTQSGVVVTPAAGATLTSTLAVDAVAGTSQNVTVTIRDAFGNVATGYRGTVNFSSSDTIATLPANYAFTAADNGVHTFPVVFKSSGGQTLTITDTVNAAMTVTQRDVHIAAGAVAGLALRAPSNVVAGTAFSITLTAVDAYGNAVSNYVGKVHFTGPGGAGNLLPADYTFTTADAGVHTFTVTLSTTGTQTINVQDVLNGTLKTNLSVKVNASGTTSGGGGSTGGGTGGGGGGGGKKV